MKTNIFKIIILALFSSVGIISCGDKDSTSENEIVKAKDFTSESKVVKAKDSTPENKIVKVKDSTPENKIIKVKDSTLENKIVKAYDYDFSSLGDKDGIWIIEQAKHFKISKINRDSAKYKYQPQENFIGIDSVEIMTNTEADGISKRNLTFYKLHFDITEDSIKTVETVKKGSIDKNVIGTWQCIGFGNTKIDKIKPIEPHNCDKCYILTFKEDSTLKCYSTSNIFAGQYKIEGKNLKNFNLMGTEVGEVGDGYLFIEKFLVGDSYIVKNNKLFIYYTETEYLIFKSKI